MCLCDQLRKIVAKVRPVRRMSLEPCIYCIKLYSKTTNIVKHYNNFKCFPFQYFQIVFIPVMAKLNL